MSDSSMTDDNSNLVDIDLDTFSKDFFNPTSTDKVEDKAEEKPEDKEEVNENEDDALATEQTEDEGEDDASEENPDGDETEEEEKPKPKGKKSFQDRIDELTAKARNEERLRLELERRLAEIEARKTEDDTKSPAPKKQEAAEDNAPKPTDVDEDGEPKYKLGEFDPAFIRDLTRYTIRVEREASDAERAEAEQKQMVEAAQDELKGSWLSKVEEAEKELPDLRENLGKVGEAFAGIDPGYGEFLAAAIMTCDFGPQIMYYLSQNIGEAQKIVASGPAAATLAIGRLDAKFSKPTKEDKRNTKMSNAPNPPENRNRGSTAKASVAADTTDLGAFEKEFFKKA